jgi:hypothetical protein
LPTERIRSNPFCSAPKLFVGAPTFKRPAQHYEAWPEQMRAETAAAFCDEPSVDAFRRSVGKLYPRPYKVPGKGDRWSREELEAALKRLRGEAVEIADAGDVL